MPSACVLTEYAQIRVNDHVSGVGATDLKIRRGDLDAGHAVAAWLPSLGGYGEYALAAAWTRKPRHQTGLWPDW